VNPVEQICNFIFTQNNRTRVFVTRFNSEDGKTRSAPRAHGGGRRKRAEESAARKADSHFRPLKAKRRDIVLRKPGSAGRALRRRQPGTTWHHQPPARGIRRYPTESSFALKRLQHVFRQGGVEIIRHGELAPCQTDGTRVEKWRRIQNGEQAGRFLRQGFRAFRRNAPVVNFDFNG
jgi:hypothetical protein